MFTDAATEDFFRARLDHMIDLRHSLAVLASRMPWQQIEASVAHLFSRRAHTGEALPDLDLFGEAPAPLARQSNAGRPRVPLRTMIALLYLKHAFNLSDEAVVQGWSENPYWQHFAGMAYFEPRLPCDATTLVKFRRLLGEEGVEELLAQTVNLAVSLKLIPASALATVVVDSTVQEKAVAHPTDSKLLETARAKLVEAAQGAGIELKQTFAKEGQLLRFKAGRYAHARQFKRMRRVIKRQRTVLGRLVREIERKASVLSTAVREALDGALGKAQRIADQARSHKLPRRRQAIEPIIGHLKADHRMDRCHLKGEQGDRLHAVLCAAGYNLRWLLRMIAKKGVPFLQQLYLRLCQAAALSPNWPRMLRKLAVNAFREPAPRLVAG